MAVIANGPGTFVWTDSPPNHNPGQNGAKFAVNKNTHIWYEWVGTTWVESGDRIQRIPGTGAPNYTPTNHQSRLVINQATPTPGLYVHVAGTTWVKLNAETPQTLSLTGQDLTLSGGGGTVTLPSGADFPLLAPFSTSPNYGFSDSAGSGLFFDGSLKMQAAEGVTLDILGHDASGDAGGINIQSGAGDTGGGFSIRSGAGASRGGVFVLAAGESVGGEGGSFTAQAGDGAIGGSFLLRGGHTAANEEFGGSFDILGGASTDGYGGTVGIRGGTGFYYGGNVGIFAGQGGTNFNNGNVTIGGGDNASFNRKGFVILDGKATRFNPITVAQRATLTSMQAGDTIYCSDATATDGSTGVTQTYNGTTWKNHW